MKTQNLIEERPNESDRRIKEVRIVTKNINPFLNSDDIIIFAEAVTEFKKWLEENSSAILTENKETYLQDLAQINQHLAYSEEKKVSEWVSLGSSGKTYFDTFKDRFQKRNLSETNMETIENTNNEGNKLEISITDNSKEIGSIVSKEESTKEIMQNTYTIIQTKDEVKADKNPILNLPDLPKCIFSDCERHTAVKTPLGAPVCLEHLKGNIERVFIESGKKDLSFDDSFIHIVTLEADKKLLSDGFWIENRSGLRRLNDHL